MPSWERERSVLTLDSLRISPRSVEFLRKRYGPPAAEKWLWVQVRLGPPMEPSWRLSAGRLALGGRELRRPLCRAGRSPWRFANQHWRMGVGGGAWAETASAPGALALRHRADSSGHSPVWRPTGRSGVDRQPPIHVSVIHRSNGRLRQPVI